MATLLKQRFMLISSEDRVLNFGLNLHLHLYFVYASIEGSDKSAHIRKLTDPLLLTDLRHWSISCFYIDQH